MLLNFRRQFLYLAASTAALFLFFSVSVKTAFSDYGRIDSSQTAEVIVLDNSGAGNSSGIIEDVCSGEGQADECPTDYEWYRISISSNGFLTIATSSPSRRFDDKGELYLETASGTISLVCSDDNSGENYNFRITVPVVPGDYLLCISPIDRRDSSVMGQYNVNVLFEGVSDNVWFRDSDNDGYGLASDWLYSENQRPGYVDNSLDCNDSQPDVNPSVNEKCNQIDDNCNGSVDEGFDKKHYYRDNDGDGYGLASDYVINCSGPLEGYVESGLDCNDSNPEVHPSAKEQCDNIDNNCNGEIDEDVFYSVYYYDGDNDGYGVVTHSQEYCSDPGNRWTHVGGDCDDGNSRINPGMDEVCGNGVDENCTGADGVCSETEVCMNISDIPLETRISAAPAIVMIVYDDSESMDYDILDPDSESGCFHFGDGKVSAYYEGVSTSGRNHEMASDVSAFWKVRCHTYNTLYYNPEVAYVPWPYFRDANPYECEKHPVFNYGVHNLDADQYCVYDGIKIGLSHYFIQVNSSVYLVNLHKGKVSYYRVSDMGSHQYYQIKRLTQVSGAGVPAEIIIGSYDLAIRNFANWYKYHRNRELSAKYSVASLINSISGVRLGIYPVSANVKRGRIKGVSPVRVNGVDTSRELTEYLYSLESEKMNDLKKAFFSVGRYLDASDSDDGGIGESPYESSDNGGDCQQAFCVLVTDGYYSGSGNVSVGNTDGGSSDSEWDGGVYADQYSDTLADIAMYFYERDLAPDLDNLVSGSGSDKARHQHLVTYSVAFGGNGHFSPPEYQCPDRCPVWPNPEESDRYKIDDLWHAAVNGRGLFFRADSSDGLYTVFQQVLTEIEKHRQLISSIALNSKKNGQGGILFQSFYNSEDWSGDLRAYPISEEVGGGGYENFMWSASDRLKSIHKKDGRCVLTFDGKRSVPFKYSFLSDYQKTLLTEDILNYIRGDNSNEIVNGGEFRDRKENFLGDIVHSAPVVVPDGTGDSEEGMVYIGANDGMLHGFDLRTGEEQFAYVPSFIMNKLNYLVAPEYSHKYFVDTTVTSFRIADDGADQIVLFGGLGKGGRGVFAIDVTHQKQISEVNRPFVFEYPLPSSDDLNMGFSYSRISAVKTNDDGRYVVLFGNGYDSPAKEAVLYVLGMDGQLIKKIIIDNSDAGEGIGCNGLSSPVPVDMNNDGRVDVVYAGDLAGNMWKFDFSGSHPDSWNVFFHDGNRSKPLIRVASPNGATQQITALPAVTRHKGEGRNGVVVIFGTGQYLEDSDRKNASVQTIYGVWDWSEVWANKQDETVSDKYLGDFLATENGSAVRGLSNSEAIIRQSGSNGLTLLKQNHVNDVGGGHGTANELSWWREVSANEIEWFSVNEWCRIDSANDYDGGVHVGWHFDLPDPGERIVSGLKFRDGYVLAVSMTPADSPCKSGGRSVLYYLNAYSGGAPDVSQFDTDGNGVIDEDDASYGGAVYDDVLYREPEVAEESLILDKNELTIINKEKTGLFYWKILE